MSGQRKSGYLVAPDDVLPATFDDHVRALLSAILRQCLIDLVSNDDPWLSLDAWAFIQSGDFERFGRAIGYDTGDVRRSILDRPQSIREAVQAEQTWFERRTTKGEFIEQRPRNEAGQFRKGMVINGR